MKEIIILNRRNYSKPFEAALVSRRSFRERNDSITGETFSSKRLIVRKEGESGAREKESERRREQTA